MKKYFVAAVIFVVSLVLFVVNPTIPGEPASSAKMTSDVNSAQVTPWSYNLTCFAYGSGYEVVITFKHVTHFSVSGGSARVWFPGGEYVDIPSDVTQHFIKGYMRH